MERELIIINFYDGDGDLGSFIVKTELSEKRFAKRVVKIVDKFTEEDYLDWNVDEIIAELDKLDKIEVIPTKDTYEINV